MDNSPRTPKRGGAIWGFGPALRRLPTSLLRRFVSVSQSLIRGFVSLKARSGRSAQSGPTQPKGSTDKRNG